MNFLPFIGAAVLLTMAVLTWLLYPLLRSGGAGARATASRRALNAAIYRDQLAELERDRAAGNLAAADYAQARDELQHRLLQDAGAAAPDGATGAVRPATRSAFALVILLPLAAAGLYGWLGNPAALDASKAQREVSMAQIDEMVAKLAARMEKNPDDTKGWIMLARSYKALRRFDEAEKAFGHLSGVLEGNPDLLTDYADLLAARAGGNLEGKPLEMVNRALQLDPKHTMALALAGTAAYNRNDLKAASGYWETLLQQLPPESDDARSLNTALTEIREKLGSAGKPAQKTAAAGGKAVSGKVILAPALAGKVKPDDTVFVFARAVDGPRMPLAALRARVADLPLTFTLDDTLALNPQMKISAAAQVKVEARIAKSGNATPQPGDFSGESGAVAPGAKDVRIVIERTIP